MEWVFLTRLYKNAPVRPGWLTKNFGKNVDYSPIPKVRILSESGSLSMSNLGKVYDPAKPVKVASNVSELLIDPAQIYEYDILTEDLLFAENYNPQVVAIQSGNDVISSKDYLYAKKVAKLKERVNLRIEWMFAQVVSTGAINYNDGETAFAVNYGVTPDTYTLNASAKVVSDLQSLVDKVKQNGFAPSHIIVTRDVAEALWDNTQFGKAVDKTSWNIAEAQFQAEEPFVTFIAKVNGLPPIYAYGGNVGGSALISGSKIIVADANAFGVAYGAIINANLDKGMNPIQTDVAVWEAVAPQGDEKYLFVKSRPLPYLANANAVKVLNVTIA